jgi:hypothetical protein
MIVLRKYNFWLKPELCFTITGDDMNMLSCFLSGKKEEPVPTFSEHRGAYNFAGMLLRWNT